MKIKVNLTSTWSLTKSGKGQYCKAVYLDVENCEKVYGVVFAKAEAVVLAPQDGVQVNLRQWGTEEYNGRKSTRFVGFVEGL